MVDNQTAKTNKHLKKRKKIIPCLETVEFQSWLFWCYSFSIQSCLSVSPRQVWSWCLMVLEPFYGGWQLVCWQAGMRVVAWWVTAWWAGGWLPVCQQAGGWAGGGGMGMVACLFFQCIIIWISLSQARGSA
jgi:hypothetical protein